MRKLWAVSSYTIRENIRSKIFYVILLFAMVVIASSFLFSKISGEVEARVIVDVGLGMIEMFAFLMAIFGAVRLILLEMENKTIYLILSRPVERYVYIMGRYLGMLAIVLVNILIMFGGLVLLLLAKKYPFQPVYLGALGLIFCKIVIITAVGLLLSLVSTSAITSITTSFFIWVVGHFSQELRFLTEKTTGVIQKALITTVYYLLPHFEYFNLKDYIDVPGSIYGINILWIVAYCVVYSGVAMCLAVILFRKREF
jgi:ABC-type transport system involved in multi-copper enzyme maturation permease subunit